MKKTKLKIKSKIKLRVKIKANPKKKAPAKKVKKIKKTVVLPKAIKIQGKLIGKVEHYFSDLSVGIIKLSQPLNQGDEIRIIGGEATDFNQKVASMQFDHKEIKKAKKGQSIGLKVKEIVREGYKAYKI